MTTKTVNLYYHDDGVRSVFILADDKTFRLKLFLAHDITHLKETIHSHIHSKSTITDSYLGFYMIRKQSSKLKSSRIIVRDGLSLFYIDKANFFCWRRIL